MAYGSKSRHWLGVPGGMGRSFKSKPYSTPDAKTEYVLNFSRLDGGLNIYDLDYRLDANESPDMQNLHWRDGALSSRSGQTYVVDPDEIGDIGRGYATYSGDYWGRLFLHIGAGLYMIDPTGEPEYTLLCAGVPENRGTFFRYKDNLYYKNRGGYYRITYSIVNGTETFSAKSVVDNAFVPVTYTGMNPSTHAGQAFQPENRLTDKKTVWYNAESGIDDYYLPDSGADVVVYEVFVDGTEWLPGSSGETYAFSASAGKVHFNTPPDPHVPVQTNTVRITYGRPNSDALKSLNSILDCNRAIVYGGDQNLCIVLGGCPSQPNAYFWSGNNGLVMADDYFPMLQYNLAGDTEEEIVGFGKQQNDLIIFKRNSLGKASCSATTAGSDLIVLQMPYTAINSRIGCDLPWSIQLVENNLVFCNTKQGAFVLLNTSYADENNVEQISRKVNGDGNSKGLLFDVRQAGADMVVSADYHENYWICANGHAYLWDYELSTYKKPSWFYYTNVHPISFSQFVDDMYHLNVVGGFTKFVDVSSDYDRPIKKVYQFATQNMGNYDRYKDVRTVIFVVRSDRNTTTNILYRTDYEDRYDLTPLRIMSNSLVPRNLRSRFLGVLRYARVERRQPMCRHIRHFAMRLENEGLGEDLSVISAQIFYTFQGRQK